METIDWGMVKKSTKDSSSSKNQNLSEAAMNWKINKTSRYKKKIPSEMEVAPLHNPFDPLIHNLFKNFRKFKTKKFKNQLHINIEQNEDCRAYARRTVIHTGPNYASAFAQALIVTENGFKTWHNLAPCIIFHLA